MGGKRLGELLKRFKSFCGSAFKAAFFVPTLLVISYSVRLCTAGCTAHRDWVVTQSLEQDMEGYVSSAIPHPSSHPQFLNAVLEKDWHVVQQDNRYIGIGWRFGLVVTRWHRST